MWGGTPKPWINTEETSVLILLKHSKLLHLKELAMFGSSFSLV